MVLSDYEYSKLGFLALLTAQCREQWVQCLMEKSGTKCRGSSDKLKQYNLCQTALCKMYELIEYVQHSVTTYLTVCIRTQAITDWAERKRASKIIDLNQLKQNSTIEQAIKTL